MLDDSLLYFTSLDFYSSLLFCLMQLPPRLFGRTLAHPLLLETRQVLKFGIQLITKTSIYLREAFHARRSQLLENNSEARMSVTCLLGRLSR